MSRKGSPCSGLWMHSTRSSAETFVGREVSVRFWAERASGFFLLFVSCESLGARESASFISEVWNLKI